MNHKRIFTILAIASFFCFLALKYRSALTGGSITYFFLIWNLFLAWIPYLSALWFEQTARRNSSWMVSAPALLIWLLFLPNAPYIITDFVHFRHLPPVPLWFDLFLLFSTACTGLLLGLVSLAIVHRVLRRSFSGLVSWILILISIGLAGFGVWLGRFQRWNSWDIISRPEALLADIMRVITTKSALTHAVMISLLLSGILLFGYMILVALMPAPTKEK